MTHIFVTSHSTNYLCWYSKPVSYRTNCNETCNMACLTYDTLVTYLYIGTYKNLYVWHFSSPAYKILKKKDLSISRE